MYIFVLRKRSDFVKHGNTVHNGNVVDDVLTKEIKPKETQPSLEDPTEEDKEFEKEYNTTILVEENERILLNKFDEGTEEYLPVTLLEYKCRFCTDGFISGAHLKRHMRIHQNELPFACGLCKQEFG